MRRTTRQEELPTSTPKSSFSLKNANNMLTGIIQTKLKISHPSDKYEKEAEKTAENIMSIKKSNISDSNNIQNKYSHHINKAIQVIHRKPDQFAGQEIDTNLEKQIHNISGGNLFDSSTRKFMEPRFEHDFSQVRIHNDSRTQNIARVINAKAFTIKNDIFLGSGESVSDKKMLAHELTHVIQQTSDTNNHLHSTDKSENQATNNANSHRSKVIMENMNASQNSENHTVNRLVQIEKDDISSSIDKVLSGPAPSKNRDATQKKEDLRDAEIMAQRIMVKCKTTQDVKEYFPEMIRRFGLRDIAWIKLGTPSAALSMEINPKTTIDAKNNLILENGTKRDKVSFFTGTVAGETVGIKMSAELTPQHGQGGPPKTNALKDIMSNLPTKRTLSNTKKYIRGHLLNDNLGGPGEDKNLFPITASANNMHSTEVESKVKEWVNKNGYNAHYLVEINNIEDKVTTEHKIESNIYVYAHVKGANGNKIKPSVEKTITSKLDEESKIENDTSQAENLVKKQGHDPSKVELSPRSYKTGKKPEVLNGIQCAMNVLQHKFTQNQVDTLMCQLDLTPAQKTLLMVGYYKIRKRGDSLIINNINRSKDLELNIRKLI